MTSGYGAPVALSWPTFRRLCVAGASAPVGRISLAIGSTAMTRSLLVCLKENRGLGATVFEILSVAIYPALLTLPYCTMRLGLQEHIEAAASASHIIRSLALFSIAFGLSPNAVAVETILHVKIELLLELALGFQDQMELRWMALLHALRQASWTLILPMQMGASPYWALLRAVFNWCVMMLFSALLYQRNRKRFRLHQHQAQLMRQVAESEDASSTKSSSSGTVRATPEGSIAPPGPRSNLSGSGSGTCSLDGYTRLRESHDEGHRHYGANARPSYGGPAPSHAAAVAAAEAADVEVRVQHPPCPSGGALASGAAHPGFSLVDGVAVISPHAANSNCAATAAEAAGAENAEEAVEEPPAVAAITKMLSKTSHYKSRQSRYRVVVKMDVPGLEPETLPAGAVSDLAAMLHNRRSDLIVVNAAVRRGCVCIVLEVWPTQGHHPVAAPAVGAAAAGPAAAAPASTQVVQAGADAQQLMDAAQHALCQWMAHTAAAAVANAPAGSGGGGSPTAGALMTRLGSGSQAMLPVPAPEAAPTMKLQVGHLVTELTWDAAAKSFKATTSSSSSSTTAASSTSSSTAANRSTRGPPSATSDQVPCNTQALPSGAHAAAAAAVAAAGSILSVEPVACTTEEDAYLALGTHGLQLSVQVQLELTPGSVLQGWRDYGPGSHTGPVGPNTLALLAHCPSGYLEVEVAAAPAPAAASAQPSTVQAFVTIPPAMAQALSTGTEALKVTLELWSSAQTLLSAYPLLLLAPHLSRLASELRAHCSAAIPRETFADCTTPVLWPEGKRVPVVHSAGHAAMADEDTAANSGAAAQGRHSGAWGSNDSYTVPTDRLAAVTAGLAGARAGPFAGLNGSDLAAALNSKDAGSLGKGGEGGDDSPKAFLQDLAEWLHYTAATAAVTAQGGGACAGGDTNSDQQAHAGIPTAAVTAGTMALRSSPGTSDSNISPLGLPVWAAVDSITRRAAAHPELQQAMRRTGCDLLRHAVRHGMRSLAGLIWQRLGRAPFQVPLQELLTEAGPGAGSREGSSEERGQEDAALEGGLLHLAAVSCCAEGTLGMVMDLASWAARAGVQPAWDAANGLGATPLHLLAMSANATSFINPLLQHPTQGAAVRAAWRTVTGGLGVTPERLCLLTAEPRQQQHGQGQEGEQAGDADGVELPEVAGTAVVAPPAAVAAAAAAAAKAKEAVGAAMAAVAGAGALGAEIEKQTGDNSSAGGGSTVPSCGAEQAATGEDEASGGLRRRRATATANTTPDPASTAAMPAGKGSFAGGVPADTASAPIPGPQLFPSWLYGGMVRGTGGTAEAEQQYTAWVRARMWPALRVWHTVMCVVGVVCVLRGLMSGRGLQDAPAIFLLVGPFATLAMPPFRDFKSFWLGQGHLHFSVSRALGMLLPALGMLPRPTVYNISSQTGVDVLGETVVTCFFMMQVDAGLLVMGRTVTTLGLYAMWVTTPGLATAVGRVILLTFLSFGAGLLLDAWNRAAYMAHLQRAPLAWEPKGCGSGSRGGSPESSERRSGDEACGGKADRA